jgi:hypothetical protein
MAQPARDLEAEDLRERLLAETFPRVQMSALVALAALVAFLASAALLWSGVASLAARYALAAAIGYAAFLLLVRAWLAFQGRRWDDALDVDFVTELPRAWPRPSASDASAPSTGSGGSFGGGGAGRSFEGSAPSPASATPPPAPEPPVEGASSGSAADWAPDLDEGWALALAAGALLAGFVALGFVVYASPILFAEVLLDAAVAGAVYRRARRRSRAHWLRGVVRRTWLPALALCAFVALGGFAVQQAMPEARSLGDVIRALR